MTNIAIIIPVYNDWTSFASLVRLLDSAFSSRAVCLSIYAVDDGSVTPHAYEREEFADLACVSRINLVRLITNLGHQRAIAVGLVHLTACTDDFEYVIVMDADGEDRPEDAVKLFDTALASGVPIIVAQRAQRSEGPVFRFAYGLYKAFFRLLSGHTIDFGNFCLLSASASKRLAFSPELWNHFAATIIRSRLRVSKVPTKRGLRMAGKSSMNLVSLVSLGMSAISIYGDVVFVRLLLMSLLLSLIAAIGIIAVILVRFLTNLAIPGWATNATGLSLIILAQAITLSAVAAFLVLGARSNNLVVPALDAPRFIEACESLYAAEVAVG